MDPGHPILSMEQDTFERFAFAKHLASFLCLPKNASSIVVGIEGKWGEGKTSCINLIREVLKEQHPKPIIVDYNPWLISNLDSIIEGFFVELASALGTQSRAKNAQSAAHKVLQFAKMLAPIKLIPGVEPWGSIVESVLKAAEAYTDLAKLSLSAKRRDLQEHLRRVDRPIVVVIDDVDRLPPEHIRIVFQMLKSVGDFDRVSYLVAFDPEPVVTALSYNGTYPGHKYLEKIVQISYPLPRLSFTHMKDYVASNIRRVMEICDITLSQFDSKLFETILNAASFLQAFETPRDIIRLCNKLRLSLPNTKNEVSVADVIIFETIELKFPQISDLIRNQPDHFVKVLSHDKELLSSDTLAASYVSFYAAKVMPAVIDNVQDVQEVKLPIDEILEGVDYPYPRKKIVKSLLVFLFPKLGGGAYRQNDDIENINRVRNRDALLKLLHCGVTSFTYSADEARRFCTNPAERVQILAEYRDAGDLLNWITYVLLHIVDVEIVDPFEFCDLIMKEASGPQTTLTFENLSHHLAEFLYHVIKSRPDHDLRIKLLNHIVSKKIALALSGSTLTRFLNEFGIWSDGRYYPDIEDARRMARIEHDLPFSYDELYSAKDLWLSSVRDVASNSGIMETQRAPLHIFLRWGQLNDNNYGEVQSYIIEASSDSDWLDRYLMLFQIETNVQDILAFIPKKDLELFISRVSNIASRNEHAADIEKWLRSAVEAGALD